LIGCALTAHINKPCQTAHKISFSHKKAQRAQKLNSEMSKSFL
jgi:hypothetical protein